MSSREPAVSTVGLGSESSPGSIVSEEAFRPQFTTHHHHGLSVVDYYLHTSHACTDVVFSGVSVSVCVSLC